MHDPRAEPQQLAAGEGPGKIAREIDDQQAVQDHERRRYHYTQAVD
jgi:hypothetical protein